ncbi:alpha/beta hydrolase [Colwellia sp. TT2012]|uniref:alpha/beta hydrolase n=1 Tax=Colwellia sp. TT2012 TaxID=1720342 RepID=UPI000708C9B6|nr:alpha/beta hydrolase-fold protein [Colwellia sp. TT2012]
MAVCIKIIFILMLVISQVSFASIFDRGERVTINSSVLGEPRELQILLPENYRSELKNTYPVIYLLDGDYNFHGVSGMLDLLANKGQLIPKVILVGLADQGTEKYRKYMTPNNSTSPIKNNTGSAKEFLAFLNEEVQPYINKNYRAAKHSTLVGYSMGGLFVLNALLEAPGSFNNYVAISPSVWVADSAIVDKAKEKLGKVAHENIALYLSLADEMEMGQYAFINQLDLKPLKNLQWRFKHYPDENHNSVGQIALRDSLKAIFKAWYLPESVLEKNSPEQTVKHYQEIQNLFAIQQPIPSAVVHIFIRQHYRQKNADALPQFISNTINSSPASKQVLLTKQASFVSYYDSPESALALLKTNEAEFVNNIDYLMAIADLYQQLKDKETSQQYYQKAMQLAKKQKVNQWQLNIIQAKLI